MYYSAWLVLLGIDESGCTTTGRWIHDGWYGWGNDTTTTIRQQQLMEAAADINNNEVAEGG